MIYGIVLFIVLLLGISIYDYKRVKSFEDFALAGKRQGFLPVYLSLMTSMIGASATLGVTERVWDIGFPAFWWLGVGAIGLFAQGLFLSKSIRELDATTLPDIADKTVGNGAKALLSLIIAVSWVGIIGAQILSLARILMVVASDINENLMISIIAVVVILYTMLGGQLSVIKTDMLQAGVIFAGILGTLFYLFLYKGENNQIIFDNVKLLSLSFDGYDLINLIFITGGTYFLGPDIISRNIMSKDSKTARNATFAASISFAAVGVIVTLLGMWTLYNLPVYPHESPLVYIMNSVIPTPLTILLCMALIATLLSSADTCLVNAATIIEHDLLKRNKVGEVRIIIGIMGVASLLIALTKANIIDLLLGAYSIYSPGIVCPLCIAILNYKKRHINRTMWFAAVIMGGLMGSLHSYLMVGPDYLPLFGMGLSLILSILSILPITSKKC